jgi:hypothetical protein
LASSSALDVKSMVVRLLPGEVRTPVPSAVAVMSATTAIHKEGKAEFAAARTPAERLELSRSLLRQGLAARDAARRFALFKEARDVAARAFDLSLAFQAVAEMGHSFQVEPLKLKVEALQLASSYSRNPLTDMAVAEVALTVLPEAHQADAYDHADKLLALARAAGQKTKAASLREAVQKHSDRLKQWRADYEQIKESFARHDANPRDDEANLALGKHLCFHRSDWKTGLPLLSAGSDRLLTALADRDIERPCLARARAALGQAWWDLAEKDKAEAQNAMKKRARHWFRLALPYLSGAERSDVEDRLKEVLGAVVVRPGLAAEYFDDEDLRHKVLSRIDHQVGFYWGQGSPAAGVPADHFSSEWRGWIVPPRPGKYRLGIHADDGGRLFVEGKLVIDAWDKKGPQSVTLTFPPRPHHVRLQHRNRTGPATMLFTWEQEGGFAEEVVPMEALWHESGLTRELADFKPPVLPGASNGLSVPTEIDCAGQATHRDIAAGFHIARSWVLSFDFQTPGLDQEPRVIFLWGDDRAGLDPVFVRLSGPALEVAISNCHEKTTHAIKLEPPFAGQWLKLTFCYHGDTREVELYLDDKLVRREISSVTPTVDQPMPVWLGGANAVGQRFLGKVRNVWLGNVVD